MNCLISQMLAGAALVAEDIDVVDVALRMIAGDQLEQAGFAVAVGPAELPVLVRLSIVQPRPSKTMLSA